MDVLPVMLVVSERRSVSEGEPVEEVWRDSELLRLAGEPCCGSCSPSTASQSSSSGRGAPARHAAMASHIRSPVRTMRRSVLSERRSRTSAACQRMSSSWTAESAVPSACSASGGASRRPRPWRKAAKPMQTGIQRGTREASRLQPRLTATRSPTFRASRLSARTAPSTRRRSVRSRSRSSQWRFSGCSRSSTYCSAESSAA
mmetsp:Transcript_81939/g.231970  ORF Transcript_81939/g.231970 Transcript_81939/m.231970 type:complete len:202 (+) Transcript_81939:595-1200(+)